jgi:hypothetical protein
MQKYMGPTGSGEVIVLLILGATKGVRAVLLPKFAVEPLLVELAEFSHAPAQKDLQLLYLHMR